MIDILYLGVNMGNSGHRFFPRYPQAEYDYYQTFHWLIQLNARYPDLKIAIKHHGGNYRPQFDMKEMRITANTPLIYPDNQLNSYEMASKAKMCVSYCSTMVLELNGYPNLAHFIYNARHKRFNLRLPCQRRIKRYDIYKTNTYYLDPEHRNRQFCMYIDDVCRHNCSGCKGYDLEVCEPYRLCSYEAFENKALEVLK